MVIHYLTSDTPLPNTVRFVNLEGYEYYVLEISDTDFDTKTPEEIKAWIEDWCKTNWVKEETVWVCPLMDGHISFGGQEPDWREIHSG